MALHKPKWRIRWHSSPSKPGPSAKFLFCAFSRRPRSSPSPSSSPARRPHTLLHSCQLASRQLHHLSWDLAEQWLRALAVVCQGFHFYLFFLSHWQNLFLSSCTSFDPVDTRLLWLSVHITSNNECYGAIAIYNEKERMMERSIAPYQLSQSYPMTI